MRRKDIDAELEANWARRMAWLKKVEPMRRTVGVNQDFKLFEPSMIIEQEGYNSKHFDGEKYLISLITLQTGLIPDFPLEVEAFPAIFMKIHSIAPFAREFGYQITDDDLSVGSRIAKVLSRHEELFEKQDRSIAPLHLEMENFGWELYRLGLNMHKLRDPLGIDFKPEVKSILGRLGLQLRVPVGMGFEARPWQTALNTGNVHFNSFYPLDTGPLPTNEAASRLYIREGFNLQVPRDIALLSEIRGRFILYGG